MGIDAQIFVKIKGRENWLDPKDELHTAYELASCLGHDNFHIFKGVDSNTANEPHCLEIIKPITEEEAKEYNYDESLVGKALYHQDGPPEIAEDGEQFINVHIASRYYGFGYARGDWPTIRSTIEWLWKRFPKGEVWYGGDSSGVEAGIITKRGLDELNDLYLTSGRKSYTRANGPFSLFSNDPPPICKCCNEPLMSTGGGPKSSFWYCDGCGATAIKKAGMTYWGKRDQDIFELNKEIGGL